MSQLGTRIDTNLADYQACHEAMQALFAAINGPIENIDFGVFRM